MLNGKFFTGLPPKMIDRGSAGGRNRLESHLFWPDDTKVDTAIESRLKRRNSMQLACPEKPVYEKQNSAIDEGDTRKRFSREFSQSSIQFYDNLNENSETSRRTLRNSLANKKMEIAEKPTNTKLDLPDSGVNEAYTAAKKKQAYTSKIEFYDYVNEEEESQINRNNLRKPKMDMNDKREMELNSKNSPKLQMKRDVRSLSEEKEQRKINNHHIGTMNRPNRSKINIYDQRAQVANNEENYLRSRRSVEPRINVSPKRGLEKTPNNRIQHCYSERENYRVEKPFSYERRKPVYYESPDEVDYRRISMEPHAYEREIYIPNEYENTEDNAFYRCQRDEPKRMTKNNTRQYYGADEEDYYHEYQAEENISDKMRDAYIKSPTPRRQFSPTEEYYDGEPENNHYQNDQVRTPTNPGSPYQNFRYNNKQENEVENYSINPKEFNKNKPTVNKINNQFQQKPVASPISPTPSDTESVSQKHLRSSLCFNNGEIIGENDASRSPTSSMHPTQRRNARSSATQRVSVGLPD